MMQLTIDEIRNGNDLFRMLGCNTPTGRIKVDQSVFEICDEKKVIAAIIKYKDFGGHEGAHEYGTVHVKGDLFDWDIQYMDSSYQSLIDPYKDDEFFRLLTVRRK